MLGDRGTELALATGVIDAAGDRHRRVALRPPTGHQEGWFDDGPATDPADLAAQAGGAELDELVAGLIDRIGGFGAGQVDAGLLAGLTRGDRHRLLLALRSLVAGDELRLSAHCPNPDCPEVAEIVLSVADLLGDVPPPAATSAAADPFLVLTPTRADDAAFAARTPRNAAVGPRGAQRWPALVVTPDDAGPARPITVDDWLHLPLPVRTGIAEAHASLQDAAGIDTAVVGRCPACAAWIELEPDPADLLVRALRTGAARLPAEVHVLAYHYGWSESDVLDLPRARRHRYLDLLEQELDGRPLLDAGWSS